MGVSNVKANAILIGIDDVDPDDGPVNRIRLPEDEDSPLMRDVDDPEVDWRHVSVPEYAPWWRRPSNYWLLIPFAFSALAHGGVIVPKVNLVLSLICHDYLKKQHAVGADSFHMSMSFDPGEECRIPAVQSHTATFKLAMSAISGSMAAIIAPKLGAMSDRYGRVPLLAFINCGMIINEIITIFAANFPDTISVYWILVGSVFDGMTGSFISSMAISQSYVSDCTPPSRRQVVFGWFHGCMFAGIAIGPVLAGWLIKRTGSLITMFYIAIGCHIAFATMLVFIVPESVPKHRQLSAREKEREKPHVPLMKQITGFKLLEPLKIIYGPSTSPLMRKNLILLALTDTVVFGIGMGANNIILIYSNYMWGWDNWNQAKFTSIVNSCRVTCLLVVLPLVTFYARRKQKRQSSVHQLVPRNPDLPEGSDPFELSVIRFAIFMDSVGFLGYALAGSGSSFILSGVLASIGGIGSPSMQAALTKHVSRDRVGELLGAMGLLHALSRIFGPMILAGIYARTVAWFPQLYFWVLTMLFAVAFIFSFRLRAGDSYDRDERRLD